MSKINKYIILFVIIVINNYAISQSVTFVEKDTIFVHSLSDSISYQVRNSSNTKYVYGVSLLRLNNKSWELIEENIFDIDDFSDLKFSLTINHILESDSIGVINILIKDVMSSNRKEGIYRLKMRYREYNQKNEYVDILSIPFVVNID